MARTSSCVSVSGSAVGPTVIRRRVALSGVTANRPCSFSAPTSEPWPGASPSKVTDVSTRSPAAASSGEPARAMPSAMSDDDATRTSSPRRTPTTGTPSVPASASSGHSRRPKSPRSRQAPEP
jgi:hypothetical protein